MTATATPMSQTVVEWTKYFPINATENYTGSVAFMKQLTVVAISTITYLKTEFPEDSYTLETFGGIQLRVLKKNCKDELCQFLSSALAQAFEAFDKKYLHQLALCFYEGECQHGNLLEYHIFEYTYKGDGAHLSVESVGRGGRAKVALGAVTERAVALLRACVVIMQGCQHRMPETFDVSLRLYYNENAPEDYQAPGFLPTVEEDHFSGTESDALKLGAVETKHHRIVARTYIRESQPTSNEANPSQTAPMISQMDPDFTMTSSEPALRCDCNKQDVDDDLPLITCVYCKTVQHCACYGLLRLPSYHCCARCHDEDDSRVPTDPRLTDLPEGKRECLCVYRRALLSLQRWRSLRPLALSPAPLGRLRSVLHAHRVLPSNKDEDQDEDPLDVDEEALQSVMCRFFRMPDDDDIVDRLLVETLFQETPADPIGEVLGPLEKVSLQNSQPGRVLENHQQTNIMEDSALKQYKEALGCSVVDDTPLSQSPVKELEKIEKKNAKRKMGEEKGKTKTGVRTKRARLCRN